MARTIRDAILDSRAARSRLEARAKPYWRAIEQGLHLGYRKPRGHRGKPGMAGKWIARHYLGDRTYTIEILAVADDHSDADGVAILSFGQAQARARLRMVQRAHAAAGVVGALTVRTVIESYLQFLDENRKSGREARYRAEAFIYPDLGEIEVEQLTTDQLRGWLGDLAKSAARVRTRKGERQRFRKADANDESQRRRKSSANRTLTVLKAALNRAWRDGKTSTDAAWRRVEPFENVDAARIRYLTIVEAQRLVNVCSPEFRPIVQAALHTGARYGELTALLVSDFHRDSRTIAIRQSKNGSARHVFVTDEGLQFFEAIAAGRAGDEFLFKRSDGRQWGKSHQARPMEDACERAQIAPPIGFHGLRHTYASLAVMNGAPLMVIAKNIGHADTRMVERHYGHMTPSFVADSIRASAPQFGTATPSNVRPIR